MMGVFSDGNEVLVCEVDATGKPRVNDYFLPKGDRDFDEYDFALVKGVVLVQKGSLSVEPEKILEGAVWPVVGRLRE